jgi:hypothetical protein
MKDRFDPTANYYLPLIVRGWPEAIDPISGRQTNVAEAIRNETSIGYVPVYATLQDLIKEHGDVPYTVLRRTKED